MKLLTLGAVLSFTAAASHAGIAITGAPDVYAAAAEAGSASPTLITLMLAALFAVWGLYALAASGKIAPLPLMGPAIHAITAIYLVRGMFLLPQLLGHNIFTAHYNVTPRDLVFSAIALAIGLIHLAGSEAR